MRRLSGRRRHRADPAELAAFQHANRTCSPASSAATTPREPRITSQETHDRKLQAHYGFSRMPFGRDLAPGMLHRHASHNEAVARITWCISERAIGVITGEVGAGKTVSVRTVLAAWTPPGTPSSTCPTR